MREESLKKITMAGAISASGETAPSANSRPSLVRVSTAMDLIGRARRPSQDESIDNAKLAQDAAPLRPVANAACVTAGVCAGRPQGLGPSLLRYKALADAHTARR